MNIEHFTEKACEAVSDAAQPARQYNHNQVEVEHLLVALLAQEGSVVQQVIAKAGGNLAAESPGVGPAGCRPALCRPACPSTGAPAR